MTIAYAQVSVYSKRELNGVELVTGGGSINLEGR